MTTWTRKVVVGGPKMPIFSTFRAGLDVHVEVGGGQKVQNCVHVSH